MRLPSNVQALLSLLFVCQAPLVLSWSVIPHHHHHHVKHVTSLLHRSPSCVGTGRRQISKLVCSVHAQSSAFDSENLIELENSSSSSSSITEEDEELELTDSFDNVLVGDTLVAADDEAIVREKTQKLINAIFLAVGFGWAAYTIFNIDSEC